MAFRTEVAEPIGRLRGKRQVRERLSIRMEKLHQGEEKWVPAEVWSRKLKANRRKPSRHSLTDEVVALTLGQQESSMTPERGIPTPVISLQAFPVNILSRSPHLPAFPTPSPHAAPP